MRPHKPVEELKKHMKAKRCYYPKCGSKRTDVSTVLFGATHERRDRWVERLSDAFPDVHFPKRLYLCSKHFNPNHIKFVPYAELDREANVVIPEEDKANYDYASYVRHVEDVPRRDDTTTALLMKARENGRKYMKKCSELRAENRKLKEEMQQLKRSKKENDKLKKKFKE